MGERPKYVQKYAHNMGKPEIMIGGEAPFLITYAVLLPNMMIFDEQEVQVPSKHPPFF